MHILHVELENFKKYTRHEFDLRPGFNLLVGPNGAGKTTTLLALSVVLEYWVDRMAPLRKRTAPETVARIEGFDEGNNYYIERQYPVTVAASGDVMDEPVAWRYHRIEGQDRAVDSEYSALREVADRAKQRMKRRLPVTLPIVAFYGVDRSFAGEKDAGRFDSAAAIPTQDLLSRLAAYRQCLVPKVSSTSIAAILLRLALIESADKEWAPGETVRRAIVQSIPDARDVRFDGVRLELMVQIGDQARLPLAELSDGQRAMLGLVGDLARRMAQLNQHLGDRVLAETPGVVLIDELDLHLHPTWQRSVVQTLSKLFPKVQFIATTHSPQIIGQVRSLDIEILSAGANHHPVASLGLDSNSVLAEIQGADAVDGQVARLQDEIQIRIADFEFEAAEDLLAKLRSIVEEPHPAVSRLEADLSYARALAEDAKESEALDELAFETEES